MRKTELDDLDKSIIKVLRANGRMSFVEVAARLGVSEGTIRRRVKALTSRRAITPTVIVAPTILGSPTIAILGIRVDPSKIRVIADQVSQLDEVRYLAYATGAYDLIAEVIVPTNEDLLRVVSDRLSQIDGVVRVDTSVVPQVIKATYHEVILRDQDLEGKVPIKSAELASASR